MLRKADERSVERKESPFGGEGHIVVRSLLAGEAEMYGKGRVFAHTTVEPGSEIGFHVHTGESETYYILSGEGMFNDNGAYQPVSVGDVLYTPAGSGHGLRNTGAAPLEIIALILYK